MSIRFPYFPNATASLTPCTNLIVVGEIAGSPVEAAWWRAMGRALEDAADSRVLILHCLFRAPEIPPDIRGAMFVRFRANAILPSCGTRLTTWRERAIACYLMAEEAECGE